MSTAKWQNIAGSKKFFSSKSNSILCQFSPFLCPCLECKLNKGVVCRIAAKLQPSLLIFAKFAHFHWELKFFYYYLIVQIQSICFSEKDNSGFVFILNKIYKANKKSDQDAVYEITELANIYFSSFYILFWNDAINY